MPSPTSSLATLRPDLAGSLEEFNLAMDRQGFIGMRVLPVFETARAAGPFGVIPLEQLLQAPETRRGPGGTYNSGRWTFGTDTFACVEHGWVEPIDDRESKLYADYFSAELVSTQRARDFVLRSQEQRVADLLFNATTYTGSSLTTAVTNEWDDLENATPLDDVEGAVKKVWALTGLWPNALAINRRVWRNLRRCKQVRDRIESGGAGASTSPGKVTVAQVAEVLDLSYILVGGGAKNSADLGQTASISSLWSDEYASVLRVAETGDIREPCIGRTFHWGEDGSQIGGLVETYRDEDIRGDKVRVRHDTHEKILYTEMAHLLSNITT